MRNTSSKIVMSKNNKIGNIIGMINDRRQYLTDLATKFDPDSCRSGARGSNMDFVERAQDFKTITVGVLSMVSSGNKHTSDT